MVVNLAVVRTRSLLLQKRNDVVNGNGNDVDVGSCCVEVIWRPFWESVAGERRMYIVHVHIEV